MIHSSVAFLDLILLTRLTSNLKLAQFVVNSTFSATNHAYKTMICPNYKFIKCLGICFIRINGIMNNKIYDCLILLTLNQFQIISGNVMSATYNHLPMNFLKR